MTKLHKERCIFREEKDRNGEGKQEKRRGGKEKAKAGIETKERDTIIYRYMSSLSKASGANHSCDGELWRDGG